MNWDAVWLYVVGAAIVSYFGLGIVLTIGGFFDVIKMFRRLESEWTDRENAKNGGARSTMQTFDRPGE